MLWLVYMKVIIFGSLVAYLNREFDIEDVERRTWTFSKHDSASNFVLFKINSRGIETKESLTSS